MNFTTLFFLIYWGATSSGAMVHNKNNLSFTSKEACEKAVPKAMRANELNRLTNSGWKCVEVEVPEYFIDNAGTPIILEAARGA